MISQNGTSRECGSLLRAGPILPHVSRPSSRPAAGPVILDALAAAQADFPEFSRHEFSAPFTSARCNKYAVGKCNYGNTTQR